MMKKINSVTTILLSFSFVWISLLSCTNENDPTPPAIIDPANLKWTQLGKGIIKDRVISITESGGKIYAATYNPSKLFVTTDDGITWSLVTSSLPGQGVRSMVVVDGKILLGTNTGLFISTDNGASWNRSPQFTSIIGDIIVREETIYMLSYLGGLFKSQDNGSTWTSSLTFNGGNSMAVDGNSFYIAASGNGAYVSKDNGINWTHLDTSPSLRSITINGSIICGYGYNKIFQSTDNGSIWTQTLSPSSTSNNEKLIASGDNIFAASGAGDVFLSNNNGQSWVEVKILTNNSTNANISVLLINGRTIFAGGIFGIYSSPL